MARWGYGYQDKVATERILDLLKDDIRQGITSFEGVRIADLKAGRVDDFVLVWKNEVEGNSIKWGENAKPINWGDLIGSVGLIKELVAGQATLSSYWPDKSISVRLQSNRPPSTKKHHNQIIKDFSVAEFINNHWLSGPSPSDSEELNRAWLTISGRLNIDLKKLSDFTKICRFTLGHPEPPGTGPDNIDWRKYQKQFDDLHKAISVWLSNNPSGDFIDRDYLFSAIGYQQVRSGLIQRFPLPKIPYKRNSEAAEKISQMITTNKGGYIAVTGPAGIGKSTLVQDILSVEQFPFFIPYYAFLPEGEGNPRDRGEALTFFQDIVERLDKFNRGRYSLGISDIAQGRDALREHMAKAKEQFLSNGQKTILLIDGLDHVLSEVGLQQSILYELPRPDEIPDGFLIILSCQPQALFPGSILPLIANQVDVNSLRRVEVSGLSRHEIDKILRTYNKFSSQERNQIYRSCQGNPLILVYILKMMESVPDISVAEAINHVGSYQGDMSTYYSSALAVPLQDANTRKLLGLLCRAAPTIPVDWLTTWPERNEIENLYQQTIVPFIRVEDGNLNFIHNSLIAYLRQQTRSKFPGLNTESEDAEFHSILADRCENRDCIEPLGRARILHLLRANRHGELLEILSSEWLRKSISAFIPYELISPLLFSGIEAAWKINAIEHIIRLILLNYELKQRTVHIDAGELAEKFLELGRPDLAVSQIRASGRLLANDETTLDFSYSLFHYSTKGGNSKLKYIAKTMYQQSKPLSYIYQNEPIDIERDRDTYDLLMAWVIAGPLFEDTKTLFEEIKRLNFTVPDYKKNSNEASLKASLFYRALRTCVELNLAREDYQLFLDEIRKVNLSIWYFAALLQIALKNASHVSSEELSAAYEQSELPDDINLEYARYLYRIKEVEKSKEIVERLFHIRFDSYQNTHHFDYSDISYTVTLRCLQELLGIPEGDVPDVNKDSEEAYGRLEYTAREIGELLASAITGENIPGLSSRLRSLLLFHNRQIKFAKYDMIDSHRIGSSKLEVYQHVVQLAKTVGDKGIRTLADVFNNLLSISTGGQFTPQHRRYFSEELYRVGAISKDIAAQVGLSSTLDVEDEDPLQRQEACFDNAIFLHSINEQALCQEWLLRASKVSAGTFGDKDYHLSHLIDWLSRSIIHFQADHVLPILEKFARAIEVAGGGGTTDAASSELRLILNLEPQRAISFSIELIDRGVLNVSQVIEALIIGGAEREASPYLLLAIYLELLSLIDLGDTSYAATSILKHFPTEKKVEKSRIIMSSVRTNSLPSHRIEIARALQDELRKEGLGEIILTDGLKKGRDDSSMKSSLYRLPTGKTETRDQVAKRLSENTEPEKWNPYPEENKEFEWWSAIKKAEIKSPAHLDAITSKFPPPEYQDVELLVWKSKWLLEFGNRKEAKQLAEQAIEQAKEGSWHRYHDRAEKKIAFEAIKTFAPEETLLQARDQFSKDLNAGKMNNYLLLGDLFDLLEFLELDWSDEIVCNILDDYLNQILSATSDVPSYESLKQASDNASIDQALCRYLIHLLAFPVVDVGIGARRALTRYIEIDGGGIVPLLLEKPRWDSVQLEHILIALHVGAQKNNQIVNGLREWIQNLNTEESVAVRSIARRISEEQGWSWNEINNQSRRPVIILSDSLSTDTTDYDEAQQLVGGDISTAFILHRKIPSVLEESGIDAKEIRSEFHRIYHEVHSKYSWTDDKRFNRWKNSVYVNHWLKPRALVGREAAMRVLGNYSLSGKAPESTEESYDFIYPIYDTVLDLYQPRERPNEMVAMNWDRTEDWQAGEEQRKAWLRGDEADNWENYPQVIDELYIIGEKSFFIQPDREWPREERQRGLFFADIDANQSSEILYYGHDLTYEFYSKGHIVNNSQMIICNPGIHLIGSTHKWVAINSNFAKGLGWSLSRDEPFAWFDSNGELMVKSVFWKDGWIWVKPSRFDTLGEGWLVLASGKGLEMICNSIEQPEIHMWIERHSHGEKPYSDKWHLSKSL